MRHLAGIAAVLVAAGIASLPNATYGEEPDRIVVNSVGAAPCHLLTELDREGPEAARADYMPWSQGFMAGENDERRHLKLPTVEVPNKALEDTVWALYLDFCVKIPDEPFMEAVLIAYLTAQQLEQSKSP
jgi:hypothetical protein